MVEPTAVRAPVENVNDETVAIVRWLVENGNFVEAGTVLVLAETTKTSFDIEAPVAGFVWQAAEAGSDVPIGDVLCFIGADLEHVKAWASGLLAPPTVTDRTEAGESSSASSPQSVADPAGGDAAPARFSGKAAALLQTLGLDPAVFAGRGLVQEKDVLAYQREPAAARPSPASQPSKAAPPASPGGVGGVSPALGVPTRVEALSRIKRYEGRRLRAAFSHSVPSSVTVSVPIGSSSRWMDDADTAGLRSAALIAEAGRLLRVYPMFNAYYAEDQAHYYEQVNIGYAFDLGSGLKVPTIRDADRKTVREIADDKQRLLLDYLDDSLSLESLQGGTFTVTDLSGEGVTHFQPVINDGQSAILGICAEVVSSGDKAFNLVLAFDHQLGDGRTAAAFLRDLRERLIAHEISSRASVDRAAPEPSCVRCLRPADELEQSRHFLVRTVPRGTGAELTVCTICLQDWY